MVSNPGCVSALCEALPLIQDNISCLIDLVSIFVFYVVRVVLMSWMKKRGERKITEK